MKSYKTKKYFFTFFVASLLTPLLLISQNQPRKSILKTIIDSVKTANIAPSNKITLLEKTIPLSNNNSEKIDALHLLGKAYFNIEAYDKAYDYYSQALNIATEQKDFDEMGWFSMRLGNIQMRFEYYKKTLDLYNDALEYATKANNKKLIILIKGNIAILQSKTGPIKSAVNTLEELTNSSSLTLTDKATTLMALGNIYLEKLEIPKEAIKHYKESLNYSTKTQDTTLQIMNFQNIAESYIALNDYENAYIYNKKSGDLLDHFNSLELKSTLFLFYSEIAKSKKQYSEAYQYLKSHHKLNDSIISANNSLKIMNLETTKEIEKHKADLANQTNKVYTLEREKYIDSLKTTILLISIALLICVTYLLVKRAKGKIKSLKTEKSFVEDKLDFNKEKIEKMALNISTNQEYVASFSNKIKDTLTRIKDKKDREEVTKLLREIQSYKIVNEQKEDLKNYLNKVNNDYLYSLNKKYPELSKEEQNLCVLIYLNLKNKEIANLLNLSVRSVENKRYRIRKKMDLDTNQNLHQELNSL